MCEVSILEGLGSLGPSCFFQRQNYWIFRRLLGSIKILATFVPHGETSSVQGDVRMGGKIPESCVDLEIFMEIVARFGFRRPLFSWINNGKSWTGFDLQHNFGLIFPCQAILVGTSSTNLTLWNCFQLEVLVMTAASRKNAAVRHFPAGT